MCACAWNTWQMRAASVTVGGSSVRWYKSSGRFSLNVPEEGFRVLESEK